MSILESLGRAIQTPLELVENAVNVAVSTPRHLLDSLTGNNSENASGDVPGDTSGNTSGNTLADLSRVIGAMRGGNRSEGTRRNV